MRRPPPRLALLLLASGSSAPTEWRIAVLPDGCPFAPTNFALAPSPPLDAAALKQGEALFALEYASVDAATRIWTDGGGSAQGWGFFSKLQKRPSEPRVALRLLEPRLVCHLVGGVAGGRLSLPPP